MPAVGALQPVSDRILGEHHVDRKILADVAEEIQKTEFADPVEVVDQRGERAVEIEKAAATAARGRRYWRPALRARTDCAPRSCRSDRRSCPWPLRRRRSGDARPFETAAESSRPSGGRRGGCRPTDRSRRRACGCRPGARRRAPDRWPGESARARKDRQTATWSFTVGETARGRKQKCYRSEPGMGKWTWRFYRALEKRQGGKENHLSMRRRAERHKAAPAGCRRRAPWSGARSRFSTPAPPGLR